MIYLCILFIYIQKVKKFKFFLVLNRNSIKSNLDVIGV